MSRAVIRRSRDGDRELNPLRWKSLEHARQRVTPVTDADARLDALLGALAEVTALAGGSDEASLSLEETLRHFESGQRYVRLSSGAVARLPRRWLQLHGPEASE